MKMKNCQCDEEIFKDQVLLNFFFSLKEVSLEIF